MNLSWQNVIDGNGIGITLTGMLVVFSGLALISLFIAVLPKVLNRNNRPGQKTAPVISAEDVSGDQEPSDDDLIAVISLVLHAEMQRSLGEWTQLTISRQQRHGSIWASAGRMRSLSQGGSHA